MSPKAPNFTPPSGLWPSARRVVRRALAPVERFLAIEAASGVLLLLMALVALAWANSPWRLLYDGLWQTKIGWKGGAWAFERDLHFWINDGLMTVFFFVVGLEIRREIHRGELSQLRRAALPLAAALGGMAAPAAIFALLNLGRASASGWGVPMATDIAFAVGVLALLGKRVPPALRILLLTLAVIDDVGAIVVIALFYSASLAPSGLVVAGSAMGALHLLKKVGFRSPWAYVLPAIVVWAGTYASGIHPTLAGVVVGLMTPASAAPGGGEDAPVDRLLHTLHGFVAFGIMPLFALANAGVPLGNVALQGDELRVFLGVTLGLLVGKPVGVIGIAWICAKLGLVELPRGVAWTGVTIVGLAAGIGFTMALFIAQLAFPPGPALETAKLAVLCGSAGAGALAFFVGLRFLGSQVGAESAQSPTEAESSTEA